MSANIKIIPDKEAANEPPKKMSNAEPWRRMLEDQKTIQEARQNGMTYQEIREKYGYRFTTV